MKGRKSDAHHCAAGGVGSLGEMIAKYIRVSGCNKSGTVKSMNSYPVGSAVGYTSAARRDGREKPVYNRKPNVL